MIIFGIVMAVIGFGGIIAIRIWRHGLRRRRLAEIVVPTPGIPGQLYPVRLRHPGINPFSYVERVEPRRSDDSSNDLLNTVVAAEIFSAVESSSSYDSTPSYDPPADSSPSSDFTAGGDSGGGGASGSW